MWTRPARVAVTILASAAFVVSFLPGVPHWLAREYSQAWVYQADVLGFQVAASLGEQARLQPKIVSVGVAVAPVYLNPFRATTALVPERIDQGVDFSGFGPVFALGDAIVTNATSVNYGWPGGGWITYQLTDGPDAGLMVYLAEDVTPDVVVGQHVTPSTVVGTMWDGTDGIEFGWATPDGMLAESQAAEAGGIGGLGPFPTKIGLNFDQLLVSLGVAAAPNASDPASGLLPVNYPVPPGQ